MASRGGQQQVLTMAQAVTEILSSENLAGFWQFSAEGAPYLAAFEAGGDNEEGKISVGRIGTARAERLHPVATVNATVRAIGACAEDGELLMTLEVNRSVAVELARFAVTAAIRSSDPSSEIESTRELALSQSQIDNVRLPVTEYWNVAGPLRPQAWLFSPRPVCGDPIGRAVANTADGQTAVLVNDDSLQPRFTIPEAASPQAWFRNGQLTIAFIRQFEPYRPFWSLHRYSGNERIRSGLLAVADGPDRIVDLSKALSIGPITAFAVTIGEAGEEWLFASHSDKPRSDLYAIARRKGVWELVQRFRIEGSADLLSAGYAAGVWHVVAASHTSAGWTLREVAIRQ